MRRVLTALLELVLIALTGTFGFLTVVLLVVTVRDAQWVGLPLALLGIGLTALSFWGWHKVAHQRAKHHPKHHWLTHAKLASLGFVVTWVYPAVLVAALLAGIWLSWYSLYSLPHTYDRLQHDGVRISATVGYMNPPGRGRFRDNDYYTLTYVLGGRSHQRRAFDNFSQFDHIAIGDTVPVLVDPKDPDIAYSLADVHAGTNAGIGLLSGVSLLIVVMCAYFLRGAITDEGRTVRRRRY